MRLVVTGGGTGGHIYPALAVATLALSEGNPTVYIGKTGGLEADLALRNGVPFEGVSFYGMPRERHPLLPFKLAAWLWKLDEAKGQARRLLQSFAPDVVFGTGGYVSAPVLMAAQSLKIPYVVHEPDARPGLANRLFSRKAQIITANFAEGAQSLSDQRTAGLKESHQAESQKKQRVRVTGNPVRDGIGQSDKPTALRVLELPTSFLDKVVLLVTGGSQGARRINLAIVEALPTLLNDWGLAVVHLTGKKLYDETRSAVQARDAALADHPFYWMRPYCDQMDALLALADVAVCRAGSLSLSEMYVCGIPTVLVPYPYATGDHQRKNAEASARAGASCLLEDAACTGENLLGMLRPVALDDAARRRMHEAALRLAHPNATRDILDCLYGLVPVSLRP